MMNIRLNNKLAIKAISYAVLVSLVMLFVVTPVSAFSSDETVVKNGQPAIVRVFGCPVGLESDFKYGKCTVQCGVLPMNVIKLSPGGKLIIKVIGDDDIVIQCLGAEGMKVSRD
ncbi:MAG: hypothetical protein J7L66_06115 [Anaerolineaceae bacterium]|nr:hypothetical protein [Anaerolineaceae bacterium]